MLPVTFTISLAIRGLIFYAFNEKVFKEGWLQWMSGIKNQ